MNLKNARRCSGLQITRASGRDPPTKCPAVPVGSPHDVQWCGCDRQAAMLITSGFSVQLGIFNNAVALLVSCGYRRTQTGGGSQAIEPNHRPQGTASCAFNASGNHPRVAATAALTISRWSNATSMTSISSSGNHETCAASSAASALTSDRAARVATYASVE